MNMLLDSVPKTLKINGTEYKIKTDFRIWIKFETLVTQSEDESDIILKKIKQLIFLKNQPPDSYDEETVEKILWFYRCGKDEGKKSASGSSKEVFSYDYDDGYICAAFMEQYHIDLDTSRRHWWKFRAMMLSLSDSTKFVKILGYRTIEISPKMTAEEKHFYQRMKKQFDIPAKKEVQQKYTEIENAIINGDSIDSLVGF